MTLEEQLATARKEAWSIENMQAHGGDGRDLQVVGVEQTESGCTFTYYQDKSGAYWYSSSTSDWIKKEKGQKQNGKRKNHRRSVYGRW